MPLIYRHLLAAGNVQSDALAFIFLTWARSGEARCATWDEFDLDNGLWTIPASRMKSKKEHRSPLSRAAVELLERRGGRRRRGGLAFPSGRAHGRPVAAPTVGALLAADEGTVHGVRSCGRTWAAEEGYPADDAERQLAHARGNGTSAVERAYCRAERLDERRAMMDDWAKHLAG